jgi:lysozyme
MKTNNKTIYEFTNEDMNKLYHMTSEFEGKKLSAYIDSVGILTIGIGHNVIANPVPGITKVGDKITEEQCYELFNKDISIAIKEIQRALEWIPQLTPARQAVLYDMCFNLGLKGLLGFKNTLRMVEEGKYKEASEGMLVSLWAKQVGRRAKYLSKQMKLGEWIDF